MISAMQPESPDAMDPDATPAPVAVPSAEGGTPVFGTLVVEGEWTGDGRQFAPGSLTWADLPLPLKWQEREAEGHQGAVISGRIDTITRGADNVLSFTGVMDDGPDGGVFGTESARLIRRQMLRGVSIMPDDIEGADIEEVFPDADGGFEDPQDDAAEFDDENADAFHLPGKHNQKNHGKSRGPRYDSSRPPGTPRRHRYDDDDNFHVQAADDTDEPIEEDPIIEAIPAPQMFGPAPRVIFHGGRIRSATLVAEPAFVQANDVQLGSPPAEAVTIAPETLDAEPVAAVAATKPRAVTAAAWTVTIPEVWPESWFDEPTEMPPFGALHITAAGRVYGLLGPSRVAHRAFRSRGQRVEIPRNIDYSEFQNKPCLVAGADGGVYRIPAGNITFNCGHASPVDPRRADPTWAAQHYEDSCSIAARVRVGENKFGTWVAGALLHGITPDTIERMMGCALSGDWQGGKLNAALLVPVEGFPTAAASSVRVRDNSLVAASVPIYFEEREPDAMDLLVAAAYDALELAAGLADDDRWAEALTAAGLDPRTRWAEIDDLVRG